MQASHWSLSRAYPRPLRPLVWKFCLWDWKKTEYPVDKEKSLVSNTQNELVYREINNKRTISMRSSASVLQISRHLWNARKSSQRLILRYVKVEWSVSLSCPCLPSSPNWSARRGLYDLPFHLFFLFSYLCQIYLLADGLPLHIGFLKSMANSLQFNNNNNNNLLVFPYIDGIK